MQLRVYRDVWRPRSSKLFFCALMLGLAASPAQAANSIFGPSNAVPDWVRTAAQQKLPEFPGKPKAAVLLDQTTYTVAPDGRATEHKRMVVKILRPQGREYGYPIVWFDKDSKVLSMHVWSIDAAGHEYSLKDDEIHEFSPPGEGGELYIDDKAKVADPPGRDPGGIVAYEYEKRERPYLAETNWSFQDELPRVSQSFTLALPPGYTYTTSWAHHAKVEGANLENRSYRWEMNDQPAIDLDEVPLSPGEGSLSARMTVHYSGAGLAEPQDGTWQGIGQWYDGLSRDRLTSTPEIAAKAAELTAGKTDFYDKAEAIGTFVQKNIRYFVIEMGVGGYQPHTAAEIFKGRYGDCKDKATLLSAMLSSAGIHSALLMVDTDRGVIDPEAPSIIGNHMIGAIEIPKGYESAKLHSVVTAKSGKRYLIFDPTWYLTPFGQLENNLQGSYGILMEGQASQIIALPVLDPRLNHIHRAASFQLSADGGLKGSVSEQRFGDLAEQRRGVFSGEDVKTQQEYMDRTIDRDFSAVTMTPTPAELSMKEMPGYPGVAAVVLFREQITQDDLHVVQHYERVKILTEDGKKYANVELPFVSTDDSSDYGANDKTLGEIKGRTIHADGTIVPFTGKPYLKVVEKEKGVKYQEKVFTLPDVEVGSIVEYRYNTRIADHLFESPDWIIQGDLYVKSAHYSWHPTTHELVDHKDRRINAISWFPILPKGAEIKRITLPPSNMGPEAQVYELTVNDVPPVINEEFMPPIKSFSYRVLFNFTAYRNSQEFWKDEGKEWSKSVDAFANPNSDLKSATQSVIAGATTDEDKLKKIYAAVMALENTDFTREHAQREDKADGGKVKSAADVLSRKRGTPSQLTELFTGMARAAGMKAYVMYLPSRNETLLADGWLNMRQFDDLIAIVNVAGKEVFLDPGSRFVPYGQLQWDHTFVRGLRQVDGGTTFSQTDGPRYTDNRTQRVANLEMAETGEITGTVKLTFTGSAAVRWRHDALRGDEESVNRALRTHLEHTLPKSLEVKVKDIEGLNDYEHPLSVNYTVTGTLGTPTGKRLVLPVDLFVAESSATFPHEKREQAVYFHYPELVQDALRISFKKGFALEAVPDSVKYTAPLGEMYELSVVKGDTSFTTRRNHAQDEIVVLQNDYEALRKFYTQYESKDQESVILKIAPVAVGAGGN